MSIIDFILLSMPLIRYGGPSLWRAIFRYGGPSLWRAVTKATRKLSINHFYAMGPESHRIRRNNAK